MIRVGHETIHASLHSYIEDEREYAREEINFEIANNMLNEGFSINQIAEITQLDLNTIKQLGAMKKSNK